MFLADFTESDLAQTIIDNIHVPHRWVAFANETEVTSTVYCDATEA